jgi:phosphoenolpyruvate synthase/pyruvate phosphate dikinase
MDCIGVRKDVEAVITLLVWMKEQGFLKVTLCVTDGNAPHLVGFFQSIEKVT